MSLCHPLTPIQASHQINRSGSDISDEKCCCSRCLWSGGLSWCIIVVSLYEVMLHYDTTAHINIPLYQTMLAMTDDSTPHTKEHVTLSLLAVWWRIIRSFLFQTPERLRVRAARCLTVTMTAWTRTGRRRDNEGRELTSHPSSSRSWRLCLPGTDIQTCRPGRKYQCGPTWRSPESG